MKKLFILVLAVMSLPSFSQSITLSPSGSNGNVGIGTTTPKYPLVFANGNGDKISFFNGSTSSTTNHYGIGIQPFTLQIFTGQSDNNIAFGYGRSGNFTEKMRIQGDGNVGIGTTTPKYPLVFSNVDGDKISFFDGSASNTTNHYGIGIQPSTLQIFTAQSSHNIAFGYGRSGSFTERMRIQGNGNVGINSTNPGARLQVSQTASGSSTNWGGFINPNGFRSAAFFDGTHATANDPNQAIGVATHANSSSSLNTGLLGTAGNTAMENIGVMGYTAANQSSLKLFIGVKGAVTQTEANVSYGVYGSVEGYGNGYGTRYGVYGSVTGPSDFSYGVYGSASGGVTNWAGYFQGHVYISGILQQASDHRLKHKFTSLENSLTHLSQLNGYHYYWKDETRSKSLQTGVIAQEVEKIFPELVEKDEKGFLSVNYTGFIPHLIEAVKELKEQNEVLSRQNQEFRATLESLQSLRAEVAELKNSLANPSSSSAKK